MKNKTSLVLMEQLVMVLVFALAAALCLRAFSHADHLSRENEQHTQAAFAAQNAAEILKASHGDFLHVAQLLGGHEEGEGLTVYYNEDWAPTVQGEDDCRYHLEIERLDVATVGLGEAEVRVVRCPVTQEPLFSLTVAWQEAV